MIYAITFHFNGRTPLRFKGSMPVEQAYALVATLMEANDRSVSPAPNEPPAPDAVDPGPPRSRQRFNARSIRPPRVLSQTSQTPRGDHP